MKSLDPVRANLLLYCNTFQYSAATKNFPKHKHFLFANTYTYVCVSEEKKR